ncbi:alpha/beta fold hydrolase [Marinobacterium marinum]|uniref:Alpha/beta fold hydrolase n=1 Tax=Marinobacterium marinum TaxID=2756129 RepID=A0A7W1WXB4_9GAMM|nr:alpha/beta fold hydrolase [Marinobacterium marinum]MBA4501901.1 alpha/beta fold hydrolase [Marinobacterium marinum]
MTRINVDSDHIRQQADARHQRLTQQLPHADKYLTPHLPTPHTTLLRSGSLQLLKFEPVTSPQLHTPVLICYALVNRPWILDLSPQRSLIHRLLQQGIPVYLIDWGYPERCDRHLTLDDYLTDLLDRCTDSVRLDAGSNKVNLMGVCQGGVLSLCYSLLYPHKVRNLITLVTPADTAVDNFTLSQLTRTIDLDLTSRTYGNIPGSLLNEIFTLLQPMRLGLEKRIVASRQLCDNDNQVQHFLRMEQWLQDCPDLAGAALQDFIQLFFRDNALMSEAGFELADSLLKPHDLSPPLLNIYGSRDQLVPPAASAALGKLAQGKDYTEVALDAGHIGVLNGGKALTTLPPLIYNWLQEREPHRISGSP